MYRIVLVLACVAYTSQSNRLKPSSLIHIEDFGDTPGKAECADKITRLNFLNKQMLGSSVGYDLFFPPEISSIAAPGTKCGDAAQNISENCGEFNKWLTFQAAAANLRKPFTVMGSRIKFSDIVQGKLGNCYFLAALAAVAHTHPDVIDGMFVDRDLWNRNEFRTKWLINGRVHILAVDHMIPGSRRGTFFTSPGPNGEFWPVILAKTWAKIFGSFKSIESGKAMEAIKAMTRAPARSIDINDGQQSIDSIWDVLASGKRDKNPMVASTCKECDKPGKFKLAMSHAYTVLDVYILPDHGKVVKMFNPWARHNFEGSLQQTTQLNGPEKGVFTMLMSEFFEAFSRVTIAYVMAGYKSFYKVIPAGELYAATVSVRKPGKFWVSLVIPSERLLYPCPPLRPKSLVKLEMATDAGSLMGKRLKNSVDDPDRAFEIENGQAGTYNVLAALDYKDNSTWMSEVSLTVYGPGDINIESHTSLPKDLAIKMLGPDCGLALLPKVGLVAVDMETTINSIPTYWNIDKSKFGYYHTDSDMWYVTTQDMLGEVLKGTHWSSHKFFKTDFTCVESKRHSSDLKEVAIEILGPDCKVASLPIGLFTVDMATTIGGIPTYWTLDKKTFAYFHDDKWYAIGQDHFSEVAQGTAWSSHKFLKSDFKCGCHDAEEGVGGFRPPIPCNRATDRKHTYKSIKCFGVEHSPKVQTFCPVTCGVCPPGSTNHTGDEVNLKPQLGPRPPEDVRPSGRPDTVVSDIHDCSRIPNGQDRDFWTQGGSCKCKKNAVLSDGCPKGDNFEPGERYFSKTTLATFRNDQLVKCQCARR